ncbi:porin [Ramlibacter rhizophilus]|uniref:Porin n=1 Tax=Ramlibacter rhizophilus TaxID=1781167 RepID=A0A4Z0BES9_9BURK|nr:porin [Ramlibacter rhizophilus]TFY97320.1 porin [Ramlibacter rhizophilus]
MKKTLVALAVMAAAGAASAQSSVTLFGIVDLAVQYGSGSTSDRLRLVPNGYNSSRLGFRGVEDLGGGLQASFWLEAGIEADSGIGQATNTNNQASGATTNTGLLFNRRATLSLAGGFGEVRLGRDYTPQFWNLTVFDPFGTNGVGTNIIPSAGVTGVRASNSIGYFLPRNIGGFYGQAQYYMGENLEGAATEDDGTGYGIRLGYAAGPFDVAAAYGNTEYAAADVTVWNIAGSWNFGMAKLFAQYQQDEGVAAADRTGWLIGATAGVGAGEIRAAYSQTEVDTAANPRSRKLALGYVHNLSKRTAVYTTIARVRNDGGAALALGGAATGANTSSTGFDLGVRHSF